MRRWWTEAAAAADLVAGRAELWLPGALAWALTLGPIAFVAAVAEPPTVADLTFLGARAYTAGSWPWNALAAGIGLILLAAAAMVLVAVAETVLVGGGRRGLTAGGVVRIAGIGLVTAAPVMTAALGAGIAFVLVALREFNAPGVGDPLLRSLWRIWPFAIAIAVAWAVGGAGHAAAVREAVLRDAGFAGALRAMPRRLRTAGAPAAAATFASTVANLGYLAVAGVLLAVLWTPIRARLAVDGIDAAIVPLLVGFVAIWLCLVLGGGALRAWTATTWTRVLLAPDPGRAGRTQGDPYRP